MIIKLGFWALVGLLVLPSFAPDDVAYETKPVTQISVDGQSYDERFNAITFASEIVSDLTGLCVRNPQLCVEGMKLAEAGVIRLEHGIRVAYAMVIDHREATRQ